MFIGRLAGISTVPSGSYGGGADGVWDLNIFNFFKKEDQWPKRGILTTATTTYTTTGSVLSATWPGPSGATSNPGARAYVRFYVQGAGGGGNPYSPTDLTNQSGGFVDYTHVTNLQGTYKLVVGQGGSANSGGTVWGGGGDGGNMPGRSQYGGGGGGGSFVFYEPITSFTASTPYHGSIVVCAGGGGGSFNMGTVPAPGGKGGTSTGQTGIRNPGAGAGTGGSQSAVGNSGPDYPGGFGGTNASNHQGGSATQSGYEYAGGGGGGGYYGGGAGGSCVSVCPGPSGNGSGGGGSSYYRDGEGVLNSWSQGIDVTHPKYDSSYGSTNEPGKITIEWGFYV